MKLTNLELYEQLFKQPNPKAFKLFNHWNITKPNTFHQADILFLTHDPSGDKYALTLIDMSSRYKAARPLKNKDGNSVLIALKDIYKKDKFLKFPEVFNSDSGSEFKNKKLITFMHSNNVEVKFNQPSYHLSFVESMNRNLSKRLYKYQSLTELKTGDVSHIWVNNLQKEIRIMNNTKTRLINMKPIDAIKLINVEQPKNKFNEKDLNTFLPIGTKVRRLLNSDEVLNLTTLKIVVGKRRATDPMWTFSTYEITEIVKHCIDCLYYHTIKNIETGRIYQHKLTYWHLQKEAFPPP